MPNYIINHLNNLNNFDKITKIRLVLMATVIVITSLIFPVISSLYYLFHLNIGSIAIESATIISAFVFVKNIGIKLVEKILDKLSFSKIFTYTIVLDIMWGALTLLYFYNKVYFLWFDAILGMFQAVFLIAFGTALNNYMTYFHNDQYTSFQNYRNKLVAEATMLGTFLSIVVTALSIKVAVIIFSISMIAIGVFEIGFINEFKKYDFKYMLKYKKSLREQNKKD